MRTSWATHDEGGGISARASAEMPPAEGAEERRRVGNAPLALVVTVAIALACATGAMAATGHWYADPNGTQVETASGAMGNYDFYEVDESGQRVGAPVASVTGSTGYPNYTPQGYDDDWSADRKAEEAATASDTALSFEYAEGAILGDYDPETGTWENDTPSSLFNVVDKVKYWVVSMIAQIVRAILGMGDWLLTTVDPESLFSAKFDDAGSPYRPLYDIAQKVHRTIAVPFGSAFLGLALVADIIKLTDRRRYGGVYWFESLLRLLVMYAVTWTLVSHALEVMGAIYWVGLMLHNAAKLALGGVAGVTALSGAFSTSLCEAIGTVTYAQWGWSVLYLALACLTLLVEGGLSFTIISLAVMRMGEIYLRAAFAGLPMAFAVSGDTRPMVVGYVKRFAATCFMAACVVVGLAVAPSIIGIVSTVIVAQAPGALGDLGTILANGLSIWIGLRCLDGIIKKSTDVAGAIFGV